MGFGKGFGILWLAGALVFCQAALLAGETNDTNEVKRPVPLPAASILTSFQIKSGFRIELVASDSIVSSPAAMAFDENGRLFVAEMRDYPDRREQLPRLGRIRLLEDTDGDGVFDSSHIYADNLAWPSAIACYNGGVFVAATPEILYFKDATGNGVADLRRVVFTGFGPASGPTNVDALLNSFVWGSDNRIHGGAAGIGGTITPVGAAGAPPLVLGHEDFSFDPKALTISSEAGPAHTGLCFDNRGRKYVSDFTHPLQLTMYEPRYLARNPFIARPRELTDAANPAQRIFSFPGERASVTNAARAPDASTVQSANKPVGGVMARARSCLIYRGSAFPSNYLENVFVLDPDARIIHRAVLVQNGLEVVAQRAPEEKGTEFLIGRDPSFHPSQIITGPEGALYIADMQAGGESGRIFRIVPENFKPAKPAQLGRFNSYALVATLAQNDGWNRDTATRLLFERREPGAVSLLTNMLSNSRLPQARLQALCALDGQGALTEAVVLKGLRDSDERVRCHAVALSERLIDHGKISDAVWARLAPLSADPSVQVRYQLAFTLGEINRPERIRPLAEVLWRDAPSPWFQAAVLSSVSKGAGDFFAGLASEPRWRNDPTGLDFLRQLALMIGLKGQMDEVVSTIAYLNRVRLEPNPAFTMLYGLGDGLHRIGSSLSLVDPQNRLQGIYTLALQVALDDTLVEPLRLAALRLGTVMPYLGPDAELLLHVLIGNNQSDAVQSAAIAVLGQYESPITESNLVTWLPNLARAPRREAIKVLLSRTDRVGAVLAAIESGRIGAAELSPTQVDFLRSYRDPAISARAFRTFGPAAVSKPAVMEQFTGALRIAGSASNGREIFRARCAGCHRLGGEGTRVGPDLAPDKAYGKEKLLSAIIQPSAEFSPGWETAVVETRRRENLIGIVVDQNPTTITLRQPTGVALVWPRLNIQSIQTQPWSLMPDGLEQGYSPQSMADLIEYVMTAPR